MSKLTKILIADDEAPLRLLLRATLQADCYLIDEAVDGKDVLDKLESNKPDILFFDIMIPRPSRSTRRSSDLAQ